MLFRSVNHILSADSSDTFLANAIYYLEQELRRHGYDSLLCCTGYEHDAKEKYLSLLLSKRVDAVILAGSSFIEKNAKQNQYILDAAGDVPIIIVNGYLKGDNIYCSLCDDEQAIYRVTSKLLQSGRTSPVYLYRSLSYSGRHKLAGYKRACADHGLSPDKIKSCCFSADILSVRDLLLNDREFQNHDVFITSDDDMGISVLKYASGIVIAINGVRTPDIKVKKTTPIIENKVGMDNLLRLLYREFVHH